jgi:hypothetical protein
MLDTFVFRARSTRALRRNSSRERHPYLEVFGLRTEGLRLRERVLFLMLLLLPSSVTATPRPACPAIEVGIVSQVGQDSNRAASRSDGTRVPLTGAPLLTSADVTGARASLTEGVYVLNVDITPDSGQRMQAFSEGNVGRVMAFIVDGTVKSTPTIKDPILGNGILIGAFERAEAERLADAINTGCRR